MWMTLGKLRWCSWKEECQCDWVRRGETGRVSTVVKGAATQRVQRRVGLVGDWWF